MDERGQALPLVTLGIALAGVVCLGLGKLGGAAVARAQAQTAADAAALAGAGAGEEAARTLAGANGGRVVGYEQRGADTRVHVELGGARATARARREAGARRSRGGGDPLAPAMRAALARAAQLLGEPVPVLPGWRRRHERGFPDGRRGTQPARGATPGASGHEHGLAVDVAPAFVPRLLPVAPHAGLCRPRPDAHAVHFELCPSR